MIDDFISETEEISAVVPAIVGVILAILVCIVLVAFFIGQRRRKKLEKQKGTDQGLVNEAMEKEEVPPKVAEVIEMGETNRGADLHDDDDGDLKEAKKERIEDDVKSEPSKGEHETSEDKKVEEDATTSKEDQKDEPKEDKKEDSQEDLSKDEAKDEQKTESPSGKDATEKETDDSHSPPA